MSPTRPAASLRPDDISAPAGAPTAAAPTRAAREAEVTASKAFSTSVVVSGVRCLLAYIVFPWILPLLGVARGVGPWIGLGVGVVAIAFNVASIRRFMRSGHRYRYWVTTLNVAVIGLLLVLVVRDISELLG